MARADIGHGMQVLGSDGGMIGRVDGLEGDRIKLQRDAAGQGNHHFIPVDYVDRVDEHVHLNVTAAVARERWMTGTGAAAAAAPVAERTAARGGMGWLPWLIGALIVLALLIFALRGCHHDNDDNALPAATQEATPAATSENVNVNVTEGQLSQDVQTYLAGNEATPRTFAFDNLHFDTGSSTIRPGDKQELASLAKVLATRPNLKADIVGYADAAGKSDANDKLSQDRAKAVVDQLVSDGVSKGALTARGAGEGNAAGADQAARKVELIVNAR